MSSERSSVELFDHSAENFARATDMSIEGGAYVRGELFRSMALQHIRPGGRILDYGCGPGRIAAKLAHAGFAVTGVDQSAGMIRCAQGISVGQAAPQFFVIGSLPGMFAERQWDGIVCSSVIEYIEDPIAILRSFLVALKPGGVLILSYANLRTLWRLRTLSRKSIHPHLNFQYNVWTSAQALKAVREAGFELITGPRFFESPFDRYPGLWFLSRSGYIGTLGLVVLRRPA